eukprot:scaffold207_cov409-Prasinococcus_capsulatus_cf.AAC.15
MVPVHRCACPSTRTQSTKTSCRWFYDARPARANDQLSSCGRAGHPTWPLRDGTAHRSVPPRMTRALIYQVRMPLRSSNVNETANLGLTRSQSTQQRPLVEADRCCLDVQDEQLCTSALEMRHRIPQPQYRAGRSQHTHELQGSHPGHRSHHASPGCLTAPRRRSIVSTGNA